MTVNDERQTMKAEGSVSHIGIPIQVSRLIPRSARRASVLSVALLAASLVLAACGGVGAGDSGDDSTPGWVMATFTPVPPDFTPEAIQTRAAAQAAATETAAVEPETSGTPATTEGGTPAASTSCVAERQLNEIRPPDVYVTANGARACGNPGAYIWFDPDLGQGADVQPQQGVGVPEAGVRSSTGSSISLVASESPYAIESAVVSLFVYDENIAIPQDESGRIISETPVFVPRSEPVWSTNIEEGDITFTPDVEPGRYLLAARVNWDAPTEVEQAYEPLYTSYLFEVTVT